MANLRTAHWRALLALAALAFSAQLADAAAARVTLEIDGVKRSALVVERERLKKGRRAVIVVLHGSNGTGLRVRRNLELDEAAGADAITVYPDAAEGRWTPVGGKGEDARFIRELVQRLIRDGRANAAKVFVVGASTGGMMAMRLACEQGDLFAGAAAIIANMPAELGATCAPPRPMPFLLINGTADPRVPYGGGALGKNDVEGAVLSAEATAAIFAKAAGCGGHGDTLFPSRNPKSGSRAHLERFEGCKAPVELIRIEGGGHTIPGRWSGVDAGAPGAHNVDVDAARLVIEFVRRAGAH